MDIMSGKTAIITGAGSGIGEAAALAFAREGANVVVADINPEAAEQTVQMISEEGGKSVFVQTDITKAKDVKAMVERTIEEFGGLDCAFNNAGVDNIHLPVGEYDEEEWHRVIEVNLTGTMLCMRYEIPAMLARASGAIVNCSSAVGLVGSPVSPAYISSKHGIIGLTRSAAIDYAQRNIRVNAVCPGVIRTPIVEAFCLEVPDGEAKLLAQMPMRRLGRTEEVASAVLWLCSDGASFVTGHPLSVDGGWSAI